MKTKLRIRELTEIVGVFGIILSLLFVGYQLRQDRTLFSAGSAIEGIEPELELHTTIINNPEIWIKGNAGASLTEEEFVVYERMLRIYNEISFNIFRSRQISDNDIAASMTLTQFAAYLARNPGAYKTWNDREIRLEEERRFLLGDQYQTGSGRRYQNLIREYVEKMHESPDF